MALRAPKRVYEKHPEGEGFQGVICDCIDLGIVPPKGQRKKPQHQIRYVIQSVETGADGKRLTIWTRPYGLSVHKKAAFRADFTKLLGAQKWSEDQWADFDFESPIGTSVEFDVVYNAVGENVYANLDGPPRKCSKKVEIADYTRVKDRDDYAPPAGGEEESGADDEVPF